MTPLHRRWGICPEPFASCGISPSNDADAFAVEPDLLFGPSQRVPRFFLPNTIATGGAKSPSRQMTHSEIPRRVLPATQRARTHSA